MMMRKRLKICLTILLLWSCCMAQAYDSTKESITALGITLPYRKCVIASESQSDKPCLVIYLHGGTSKGDDNEKQLLEPGTDSIANYLQTTATHAIFLIPQCPTDKSWGGPMNGVLKALIDAYVDAGTVDADRVYVFGGSMGGTGTWNLVSAYPETFAAAMPVAGNPSKSVAENVARVPVFTVMGTADAIMNIEAVETFVGQLRKLGGDVSFETEAGWTHEATCIQSYTRRRLDRVFAHRRNGGDISVVGALPKSDGNVVSSVCFATDGNPLRASSSSRISIVKETLLDGRVRCRKVIGAVR